LHIYIYIITLIRNIRDLNTRTTIIIKLNSKIHFIFWVQVDIKYTQRKLWWLFFPNALKRNPQFDLPKMTNGTYYNVLCSHAFWFVTSHSVKSLERTFKSSWTVSDKSYIQWQSILNDSDFYQITAVQLENLTTDLRLLSRVKRFLIVLNKQKRDRKSIIATFFNALL